VIRIPSGFNVRRVQSHMNLADAQHHPRRGRYAGATGAAGPSSPLIDLERRTVTA
jgi:hypothetical protein